MVKVDPATVSFGAASAVVTSIGLITGFGAAHIGKSTIVAGLLIAGLADNLSDSLSIHMYQEAERPEETAAFAATLRNFAMRLAISLAFVSLVLSLPYRHAAIASLVLGISLLVGVTWLVARGRGANILSEIAKHLAVAAVVIGVSEAIGSFISSYAH